jgi:hypothetical protein
MRWLRNIGTRGAILLLAIWFWMPVQAARAAEVSAESSDGFDSLRFSWPARVNYTAQRFGNELLIQFDRPVDGDVAGAARGLGGFIASARLDARRREVVVGLTGNHRLRTYRVRRGRATSGRAPPHGEHAGRGGRRRFRFVGADDTRARGRASDLSSVGF